MSETTPPPTPVAEESSPLPKALKRIYYIFPIVLYVPDMLFNFYVYSDGLVNVRFPEVLLNIQFYLWAFLAAGIVGMAWLLSVLAPWHWVRGHRFQSIMCWIGVVIATAITTWSSLAYRSLNFKAFATDKWITDTFHISISGFSPTMVLVAIAPPFWGLFWAIVQPAERRRSAAEERETHLMKLERLKQEAEMKRLRAESNAQIREAQLKGLAASMKAARQQIGAAITNKETLAAPVIVTPEPEAITAEVTTLPVPTPLADVRASIAARMTGEPGTLLYPTYSHVILPDGRSADEALDAVKERDEGPAASSDTKAKPPRYSRKRA